METISKKFYKKFGNNSILNSPGFEESAAISYQISVGCDSEDLSPNYHLDERGVLTISDCNRSIRLNLNVKDEDNFYNSLNKLDILRKIIEEAIKDLINARKFYLEVESEQKESK